MKHVVLSSVLKHQLQEEAAPQAGLTLPAEGQTGRKGLEGREGREGRAHLALQRRRDPGQSNGRLPPTPQRCCWWCACERC